MVIGDGYAAVHVDAELSPVQNEAVYKVGNGVLRARARNAGSAAKCIRRISTATSALAQIALVPGCIAPLRQYAGQSCT